MPTAACGGSGRFRTYPPSIPGALRYKSAAASSDSYSRPLDPPFACSMLSSHHLLLSFSFLLRPGRCLAESIGMAGSCFRAVVYRSPCRTDGRCNYRVSATNQVEPRIAASKKNKKIKQACGSHRGRICSRGPLRARKFYLVTFSSETKSALFIPRTLLAQHPSTLR